jgi:hypothetical protein
MLQTEICSQEERTRALQRALDSRTFSRSEQLRSFLRFVCEAEFRGTGSSVSEYVIGVEVLHRPKNYSPAEDSSVRTRAYELRQKLHKLYSEELVSEAIHIVVPKGAYAPQFVRVPEEPDNGLPHGQSSGPLKIGKPLRTQHGIVMLVAVAISSALLGGLLATLVQKRLDSHSGVESIVAEAWRPVVKTGGSVALVSATPLYMVLGPATHGAFGTSIYPAPTESYPRFRQQRPLASDAKLGMILTDDALGVGNMNAIVASSAIVKGLGAAPQILPERPAMMSQLRGRDALLFGAPVDSQMISAVLEKTPLTVDYEPTVREFVIRDRVANRFIAPEKKTNGDFDFVYGLVSVLNTRESDHGRLGMVVFSGITSVGTDGAAQYFSSPRSLTALRRIFQREGFHGFPPAYQVVVKCRFERMLLVSAEYYTHRVIGNE